MSTGNYYAGKLLSEKKRQQKLNETNRTNIKKKTILKNYQHITMKTKKLKPKKEL